MTTILIIEDIPDTQIWLQDAAKLAFPEAKLLCANTLEQAKHFLLVEHINITLLDLQLPDGNGVELLPIIKLKQKQSINIIVTIYDDETHLFSSLRAGAHGYILKDQSKQKIGDMLKQALSGELPLSPKIAQLVLQQFSAPDLEDLPITAREVEVLRLVASGKSTPEIAQSLSLSKYTIEDHLKNIYRKLNVSNRSEAVSTAYKLGLV